MDEDTPSVADIRPATLDDRAAIVRMMEVFNAFEGIAFTTDGLGSGFVELVAHPEWGAVLIAEVGGVPAGYALLSYGFDIEFGGRDGFLVELFVAERQRNQGVGKALLARAQTHAREHGVRALHLIVRRENASAQILYRRDGFTFDPRLLMTKTLG